MAGLEAGLRASFRRSEAAALRGVLHAELSRCNRTVIALGALHLGASARSPAEAAASEAAAAGERASLLAACRALGGASVAERVAAMLKARVVDPIITRLDNLFREANAKVSPRRFRDRLDEVGMSAARLGSKLYNTQRAHLLPSLDSKILAALLHPALDAINEFSFVQLATRTAVSEALAADALRQARFIF